MSPWSDDIRIKENLSNELTIHRVITVRLNGDVNEYSVMYLQCIVTGIGGFDVKDTFVNDIVQELSGFESKVIGTLS